MSAFKNLLPRLTTFKVRHWGGSSADDMADIADRVVADANDADVVSSLLREGRPVYVGPNGLDRAMRDEEPDYVERLHQVVLDIDIPAELVPSSTPGHAHLYIDVPGGVQEETYFRLLDALADAGVIERNYAEVSKKRGHTDLRLPWVQKEDVA